ncbi:Efflux pump aflT [Fusarium oxysporum f. sp. albedinis]|nr:Efflux pump aflT [Fusarium oxysporum f. sp. albedinis]
MLLLPLPLPLAKSSPRPLVHSQVGITHSNGSTRPPARTCLYCTYLQVVPSVVGSVAHIPSPPKGPYH